MRIKNNKIMESMWHPTFPHNLNHKPKPLGFIPTGKNKEYSVTK